MSLPQYHEHEKLIWVDVLLCHIIYGVIKISILLFYRRIFITPWFRTTTTIFMGVVLAWMLAATLGHIFSASPIDKWWTSDPKFQLEFDYEIFLTAMAGIDIGLDVFTLLLPIPVIRSLHVNKQKKLSLIGIFALGFLYRHPILRRAVADLCLAALSRQPCVYTTSGNFIL
ncbi:MAG: hypothetical protein L6R39_001009 [Caloplaca ligustica]|nr:MAG: hypothetical protein L6R39_001009 [Caloplaca ligustica]